jgi:hypothetical protein
LCKKLGFADYPLSLNSPSDLLPNMRLPTAEFFARADRYANGITAIATAILTLFAAVEIAREIIRVREARKAAGLDALGPAWLARRSCELALFEAVKVGNAIKSHQLDAATAVRWAFKMGYGETFDRLVREDGKTEGEAVGIASMRDDHDLHIVLSPLLKYDTLPHRFIRVSVTENESDIFRSPQAGIR